MDGALLNEIGRPETKKRLAALTAAAVFGVGALGVTACGDDEATTSVTDAVKDASSAASDLSTTASDLSTTATDLTNEATDLTDAVQDATGGG